MSTIPCTSPARNRHTLREAKLACGLLSALAAVFVHLGPVQAAEPPSLTSAEGRPVPPPAAPAAPYSVPWQLRPVTVGNVIRSDTSLASYQDSAGNGGDAAVSMLLASYAITHEIAPLVRLGFIRNEAPSTGVDGSSFLNPILGVTYARKLGPAFHLAGFLATTLPVGQGAGNSPDAGAAAADAVGIRARSAMDNAMFATNYITPIVGIGVAYVKDGLTVQAEATLLELLRVRGDSAASATDSARTNSTYGLHLGYYVIPQLAFGAEIRYQRWLTDVTQRSASGASVGIPDFAKDTVTFALGPRANFKVGKGIRILPGISYGQGLDKPLTDAKYRMIQVDVPVVF